MAKTARYLGCMGCLIISETNRYTNQYSCFNHGFSNIIFWCASLQLGTRRHLQWKFDDTCRDNTFFGVTCFFFFDPNKTLMKTMHFSTVDTIAFSAQIGRYVLYSLPKLAGVNSHQRKNGRLVWSCLIAIIKLCWSSLMKTAKCPDVSLVYRPGQNLQNFYKYTVILCMPVILLIVIPMISKRHLSVEWHRLVKMKIRKKY